MSGDARVARVRVPSAECRINALPNDMLLLIMSYLNACQVVQTCVLSRRWRNLWRSVPRINATPNEFKHMVGTTEECNELFKKFINRFLMLRNPFALDEFQLWYSILDDLDEESEVANLWIRHALQCDAWSIKVTIIDAYFLQLDLAVFTSGRFLKRLQLSRVNLTSGFVSQLQTGCKALQHLILSDCLIVDVEITSETLKVLTIDDDCDFAFQEKPFISIPSLVYLYFAHEKVPLLKNMESLEKACVLLYIYDYYTQVDDIGEFLKGLSGVTDLDFSYHGRMLMIENNIQWCPKFNNLTTLTVGEWCLRPAFYPLAIFLQNSPNLEDLTLLLSGTGRTKFLGELEEGSFNCEHLDSVDIVCWGGSKDDPVVKSLEEFLADNGINSDKINICI